MGGSGPHPVGVCVGPVCGECPLPRVTACHSSPPTDRLNRRPPPPAAAPACDPAGPDDDDCPAQGGCPAPCRSLLSFDWWSPSTPDPWLACVHVSRRAGAWVGERRGRGGCPGVRQLIWEVRSHLTSNGSVLQPRLPPKPMEGGGERIPWPRALRPPGHAGARPRRRRHCGGSRGRLTGGCRPDAGRGRPSAWLAARMAFPSILTRTPSLILKAWGSFFVICISASMPPPHSGANTVLENRRDNEGLA